MMRIAYVSMDTGIPVFGTKGASIHVQSMIRAFIKAGAEVTLFSTRVEGQATLPVRTVALPQADAALAQALQAEGPFDLIYERHALYTCGAMEHAARTRTPSVLEINAPLLEEQARHRTLAAPEAALDATRRSVGAAGTVVAVSRAVGDYARKHGAQRIEVIPNAIDAGRIALPRQPGPFTVGFLGSLRPWHDIGVLVSAMELLPDARLLIVGDGPDRARLQPRLDALGAEVTGMVPADQVPQHLARMDVGVAPYSASQPFYFSPLKVFDYMGAGLAVVTNPLGDLPDLIAHGITGLLCPPDHPAALAMTLARLAKDADLRARLGANARGHVMAHHTWDRVARRVMAFGVAA